MVKCKDYIRVSRETYDFLTDTGKKNESYDEVIRRLLKSEIEEWRLQKKIDATMNEQIEED